MSSNVFLRIAFSKVWRVFVLIVFLSPLPVLTQTALAQTDYTSLTLALRDGRDYYNYDVKAGQDNKFFLEVKNSGTLPISNIKISAEAPEGWSIQIQPAEIAYLTRGRLETLDVNIKPIGKSTKEQQRVIFIAESTEVPRQVETFWLTVKPAQFWLWVWAGVGALVVAGFVFVYLRFGRQ